ncbi:shikimate kinase [Microbacterium esteraromaticum]|uniref:shikimate kinase n=1 Tax=Microbacterium esteraromaticum TaxID=57043 RepID=UPI001A8FCB74|nr:shikimate kinase [Microbacterium esteraromaticum]MBN8423329.1 shikimate kinase [Microbacterium esteraromaticum]
MSTPEHPLTLVLVGPMAAGKTSVGRKVARLLDVPFIDTDKRVAAEHGPIPQIFAEQGEVHFRALERAAVAQAVAEGGVISLGGGAVTDSDTRALLARHPVVFLTVTEDAVAQRLGGSSRPLLSGEGDPVTRWRTIFEQRRGWYDEVADLTIDTSRRPMRMIAEEIAAWRTEQP